MPPPLVSLSEVKSYLGLTTATDDGTIASCASNASVIAERETGRVFAVSSNVTRRYSTDGQASIVIHDRPYSDSSRTVSIQGVSQVADTNVWFLTDRRNGDVTTTIQLRYYDTSGMAYKSDPGWWDKNLDTAWGRGAVPNDLVITGVEGHPVLPLDVKQAVLSLAALLYWQGKSGASGFVRLPNGDEIDLSANRPPGWERFVLDWRIRTAVVVV